LLRENPEFSLNVHFAGNERWYETKLWDDEYRDEYRTSKDDTLAEKWEMKIRHTGMDALEKGVRGGCVKGRLEQIHLEREECVGGAGKDWKTDQQI